MKLRRRTLRWIRRGGEEGAYSYRLCRMRHLQSNCRDTYNAPLLAEGAMLEEPNVEMHASSDSGTASVFNRVSVMVAGQAV